MKAGSGTNNNSPAPNIPSTNNSTTAANANGGGGTSGANSSLGNSAAGAQNTTIGHYIIGKFHFIMSSGKALGKGTFG